ncbi:hypothetical protein [Streptomyces sp. NPDC089919]|uniref:SCO2400 family protein n=1 Tax=Streptomyces sp. NPDC089919 TaxID=3155188 RepID=UPI00341A9630
MDYCHSCRRHLNGALACAGCGTAAAQLAPSPWARPAAEATAAPAPAAPSYDGAAGYEIPYPDPREVVGPGGREAGRRRRAAHRRRRRTALTAGTALLCAVAGTMALARLTGDDPVSDRASTVVQQEELGATQPAAEDTAPVADPSPVPRRTEVRAGPATASAGTGTATEGPAATAGPTATGEPEATGPAPTVTDSPEADPTGRSGHHHGKHGSTGRPAATGTPGPDVTDDAQDGSGGGAGEPDEPTATPTPEPTEDCTPFLWWCV